jgi:predicted amidophosphoribosyltransferase
MFYDFLNLIAPITCAACNAALLKSEKIICETCHINMPNTINNDFIHKKLDGILNHRIPYKNIFTLLEFDSQGKTQNILHNIKYKGDFKTAYKLGLVLGENIKSHTHEIDAITYVPLHKDKEKWRGFNQSKIFAEGISKVIKKPVLNTLKRHQYTQWQNVKGAFEINTKTKIGGQHILFVDDVITTGATTEACFNTLKSKFEFDISLVYIAIAS